MANSLGTLAGALVLQEALELVYAERPLLRSIAHAVTGDNGESVGLLNQTVNVRTRSVGTVNDFGTGAGNFTTADVPVTLSNFKEVHFQFTPAEYNATNRDLIRESAEPIAVAIGNHIADALAALWLTAAYGDTTQGTYDYALMLELQGVLDAAGVPKSNRFYTYNSVVKQALLADAQIVNEMNNAANSLAISRGVVPKVAGFEMHDFPGLPNVSENRVGFAGHKQATVFAVLAPKNPEELADGLTFPGKIGYVQNSAGLTVMVNQWIDSDLNVNNRAVFIYGVDEGDTNMGTLHTSV